MSQSMSQEERRTALIAALRQGQWPMSTAPTLSTNDLSRMVVAGAFELRSVCVGSKEALDMSMRLMSEAIERGVIIMETFDLKETI